MEDKIQSKDHNTDHDHLSHQPTPDPASSEPPPAPTGHHQSATQQPSAKDDLPPLPKVAPAWRSSRETLGLIFDGLVALATVVGVIFLILQWRQTEDALDQAKEANSLTTKAQADAAADSTIQQGRYERQLKAVEDSVAAAKAGQRAFLNYSNDADGGNKVIDPASGRVGWIDIPLVWSNSGATPARRVRAVTYVGRGSAPPPINTRFSDTPPAIKMTSSDFSVAPNGKTDTTVRIRLDWLRDLRKERPYIWGYVTYRDVFPGSPVRLTEFCTQIENMTVTFPNTTSLKDLTNDPGDPRTVVRLSAGMCPSSTCYDEDCPDYKERRTNARQP